MQFLAPLNGPLDLEIGGTVFGEEIQDAYVRRYRLRKHSTLAEASGTIASARPPHDMFIFTLVRNPYTRLFSIFSFLRKWENYNPDLLSMMKSFVDFREFVESDLFMRLPGPDNMFRPQCDWLKLDGKIAENVRCFKVEEVSNAIETIRLEIARRGVDTSMLLGSFPHANKSDNRDVQSLDLPPDLVAKINSFYAEDFEAFDYPSTQ